MDIEINLPVLYKLINTMELNEWLEAIKLCRELQNNTSNASATFYKLLGDELEKPMTMMLVKRTAP